MVSIKATAMVITLLTFCLLVTNISAELHECCDRYSNVKIPFNRISGYQVQTSTECPVNAIIFITKNNKKICFNPAADWVMYYVNRIDATEFTEIS